MKSIKIIMYKKIADEFAKLVGSQLFDKVEVKIGGQLHQSFKNNNGKMQANIEHIGDKEENCFLCNFYSKQRERNPTGFMELHGVVHKFEKNTISEKMEWCGYYGGFRVDSMNFES
jgi:hypothetical protein